VRIGKGGPSLGKSFPQKWKWEIEFGGTNCEEWVGTLNKPKTSKPTCSLKIEQTKKKTSKTT